MTDFETQLRMLLNKFGEDTEANTEDYILAKFLCQSLEAFKTAIIERKQGRES